MDPSVIEAIRVRELQTTKGRQPYSKVSKANSNQKLYSNLAVLLPEQPKWRTNT